VSNSSYGLTDYPDLSSDQFYRRVKLLEDADLVQSFRGKSNRILLGWEDSRTFGRFLAVERNHPEAGMKWCLERLRFEMERDRAESLQTNLTYAHTEVKQLRYALVKISRNPFRRLWRRVKTQLQTAFRMLPRPDHEHTKTTTED